MLVSSCLYAPLISAYNMPYQSLGAELTPDYNERTSVMSWRAVAQTLAAMLGGWAWWFASRPWFDDPQTGEPNLARGARCASAIAGGIMILSGLAVFGFVRERYYEKAQTQEKTRFVTAMKQTVECRPFLVLLGTALLFAVPTALFGHLSYYVQTYYVFNGDAVAASTVGGWAAVAYGLLSLVGVQVVSALSRRFGKRHALRFVLLVGAFALGSCYWLYTPAAPWLCVASSGLYGFTSTGIWVVLPSMCADVVDFDELSTKRRREGAFSSVFSWVLKVGMSTSMLVAGPILTLTGFDSTTKVQSGATLESIRVMLAVPPAVACGVAFLLMSAFPLTRERMERIRTELEARRGAV
jgi:GPH family glycoside/pentoside/hexuronide:cation symporter